MTELVVKSVDIKGKSYPVTVKKSQLRDLEKIAKYVNKVLDNVQGDFDSVDRETLLIYALLMLGDRSLELEGEIFKEKDLSKSKLEDLRRQVKKEFEEQAIQLMNKKIQMIDTLNKELKDLVSTG